MTTATAPADTVSPAPLVSATGRLVSLDAFRGLTIVGMILVNNPGTWAAVYPPLLHAAWHGWTPTDLIFPFFLFIVGVSLVLAYERLKARGVDRGHLVQKAARRALVLFGLGVFMAAWPFFTFEPSFGLRPQLATVRIPGVLQRIAVCYLAVSVLYLYLKPRWRYGVGLGLLFIYWALMMLVPVPGYGPGQLAEGTSTLAGYLDRLLLGNHLWAQAKTWDPEGLLSTLPAITTTLIGVWAGELLTCSRPALEKTIHLFARGVVLVIVGYVWDWFFPINKSLWTSSYAVFTGGQALCALGLCYWLADVRGWQCWTRPFVVYGVNAITVFVMSGLLAKSLILFKLPQADGTEASLQALIFQTVFVPLGPPRVASLLYALTWVLGWYAVLHAMYRRNLVLKV
jgi:predicted acyltransferase